MSVVLSGHNRDDAEAQLIPTKTGKAAPSGRTIGTRLAAKFGFVTFGMVLGFAASRVISTIPSPQAAVTFATTATADEAGRNNGNERSHRLPAHTLDLTSTNENPNDRSRQLEAYEPASSEKYVLDHLGPLGYSTTGATNAKGCTIWTDEKASPIYNQLKNFSIELNAYYEAIDAFEPVADDLRTFLTPGESNLEDVCNKTQIHPDGLLGIFKSGQLSLSSSGYVEPLLPPMRHPGFCDDFFKILNLRYLVHDFSAMCRKLKKHSRVIFVDMGASLSFHGDQKPPSLQLIELYRKFGFHFDHIYAYEITPAEPQTVFDTLPRYLMPAYHWTNVGVSPERGHHLNPLEMLADHYTQDDLIIVKLDVDTNSVELPLAKQLVEDDRFVNFVDQFYFEHHVHLKELALSWKESMEGSVADSLQLFYRMRERGIPSHFWP